MWLLKYWILKLLKRKQKIITVNERAIHPRVAARLYIQLVVDISNKDVVMREICRLQLKEMMVSSDLDAFILRGNVLEVLCKKIGEVDAFKRVRAVDQRFVIRNSIATVIKKQEIKLMKKNFPWR